MTPDASAIEEARRIMQAFTERTGLVGERPPRRYLWTDAFAVCNFLGLGQTDLALQLVDQVHYVLGRFRDDDVRAGWLAGRGDAEGELHPTRGGLRIGKPLPERRAGEPLDERLEWDRDGQYFHYLTRWMHALDQVSRATRQPRFNLWARELAEVAHRAFTGGAPAVAGRRMVWKMSSDLTRPLVPSMGHHDPLDGFVTCLQLRATASILPGAPPEPALDAAVADYAGMIAGLDPSTPDPLGLGGLLTDALRVARLVQGGALPNGELLDVLLASALDGLAQYAAQGELELPASRRLAFRELGLAIGLEALERLAAEVMGSAAAPPSRGDLVTTTSRSLIQLLGRHAGIGAGIRSFWRDPSHYRAHSWTDHLDINEVMLATALAPDGFLARM